jgi:uncharacterized protein (DUF2235 family)
MSIYKSIDVGLFKSKRKKARYWDLLKQFRDTFARDTGDGNTFGIHFVGLWDTVSSYGWLWNPRIYTYTAKNLSLKTVRHAVSIDEHRAFFRQNLLTQDEEQDFKQYWFPGVHADVGGGYPEADGGLWRVAFEWMVSEAAQANLRFDDELLLEVRTKSTIPARPWLEYKHKSLLYAPWWWIAEFVFKFNPVRHTIRINLFRPRRIPEFAKLHQSALLRIREDKKYRPWNLSRRFIKSVCDLEAVPEQLEYQK